MEYVRVFFLTETSTWRLLCVTMFKKSHKHYTFIYKEINMWPSIVFYCLLRNLFQWHSKRMYRNCCNQSLCSTLVNFPSLWLTVDPINCLTWTVQPHFYLSNMKHYTYYVTAQYYLYLYLKPVSWRMSEHFYYVASTLNHVIVFFEVF